MEDKIFTHLTNEDVSKICDYIDADYKNAKILKEAADLVNASTEKVEDPTPKIIDSHLKETINNLPLEELRKRYINTEPTNEVFDDPEVQHAPCAMPFIPEMNFTEKNEDTDDGVFTNVLPTVASDALNNSLSLK